MSAPARQQECAIDDRGVVGGENITQKLAACDRLLGDRELTGSQKGAKREIPVHCDRPLGRFCQEFYERAKRNERASDGKTLGEE
jgi:hypothetical protein